MDPRGLYKDQKAVFVSHLYRGYEGGLAFAKQLIKFLKRRPTFTFGTGFIFLFAITGFFVVRASFFYLYPKECSGDWQNNQNAAGKPDLEPTAEPTLFTDVNAAILDGGANRQIICSGFYGEETAAKILRVRLVPSWVFIAKDSVPVMPTSELPSQPPSDSPSAQTNGSQDSATPPEDQSQTPPPETPPDDQSQTPLPETPPADQPQTPPPDTPPSEQPQTPPPDTPPVDGIQARVWSFFGNRAFAAQGVPVIIPPGIPPMIFTEIPQKNPLGIPQDIFAEAPREISASAPSITTSLIFNGIDRFLDIQYSLDGQTWKSVDNASLELPLINQDELHAVKVKIISLRDGTELPKVFLESLHLEVKYLPGEESSSQEPLLTEEPVSDDAGIVQDITSVVSSIPPMVQNLFSGIVGGLAMNSSSVEKEIPIPVAEFRFDVKDKEEIGSENAAASDAQTKNVSVETGNEGKYFTVSGQCASGYYTVLIFANPDDYLNDPTKAVFNRAGICENNYYTTMISGSDLPQVLPDGLYYVVPTEQKETGPWMPVGVRFKLEIKRITVLK